MSMHARHPGSARRERPMEKQDYFLSRGGEARNLLHEDLGVPITERLPKSYLERIREAKKGAVVENPTKVGRARVKATKLLKERVNYALNAEEVSEHRYGHPTERGGTYE